MKIGDKVFLRDHWITKDYMIQQAEIIDIGYKRNSVIPFVYLVEFVNGKSQWFYNIALKKE